VRDVLLYGGFDLADHQVYLEEQTSEHRRIDVSVGGLLIECKKDLRTSARVREAEPQLGGYLRDRETNSGTAYAGVLTDGLTWRLYRSTENPAAPEAVASFDISPSAVDEKAFRWWLGTILATEHHLKPTVTDIHERLGAGSPALKLALGDLRELWSQASDIQAVQLKRHLWAKLLRTAFGTQFENSDDLFVEHTYLVMTAVLIGHAVVDYDLTDPALTPGVLLGGQLFAQAGYVGVGEAGFFDWVLEVPDGERIVRGLVRRVACFDWSHVEHDVLKVLYESVIDATVRKQLGEYYTPDWLAEKMVAEVVTDPLHQRVLDPSCGSGTFLFHAVRRYLAAAEEAGHQVGDAVAEVTSKVFGIDLHPVAVNLAQVTYLLAIGRERLDDRSGQISIPVYLGDSMRWESTDDTETLGRRIGEVVIYTTDSATLFDTELRFPERVVKDVERFDRLVAEMTTLATDRPRRARRRAADPLLSKFGIHSEDKPTLLQTYGTLCDLYDNERNHIWGFYIRNQARPAWFADPDNRVDVLVGNPPWLAYRYMTQEMQGTFRSRCQLRSLWTGGRMATHQDLSGFFVARSVELYLRVGGRFGFVTPHAALSRPQFDGFRGGQYDTVAGECRVEFAVPWDLSGVRPHPFPMPSAVLFGSRSHRYSRVPNEALRWKGRVGPRRSWLQVEANVTIAPVNIRAFTGDDDFLSPYGERFRQGATLTPRMASLVRVAPPSGLAPPRSQKAVESRSSDLDKSPWKALPPLTGIVETIFMRPVYLGESLLPFRTLEPETGLLPYDGQSLLQGTDDRIERYPGFANWWRKAEALWDEHKGEGNDLSLLDRFDYHGGLREQVPIDPIRVLYPTSGSSLVAAILEDSRAVVDHKAYWCAVGTRDEARYLCAVLNSTTMQDELTPNQSLGAFGPRDIHKYPWFSPVPDFDPADSLHRELVALGQAAELEAELTDIRGLNFKTARRVIRSALREAGIVEALEVATCKLMDLPLPEALDEVLG
jgi:SAM-dependent methyltransferase